MAELYVKFCYFKLFLYNALIASQLKVKYFLEELGMAEKRIYLWEFVS